jgi:hypothetical protein
MFDILEIKEQLKNIIGFKSGEDYLLNDDLTTTTSSLVINEYHPLLRLSVLDAVRPENMELDEFLTSVRDQAVARLINDVFTQKQMGESVKENLINTPLFESTASISNLETPKGRFVGIVLKLNKTMNLKSILKKVSLQLLEAQPLTIHLKHSSQFGESLRAQNLSYTKAKSTQWFDLDFVLKYFTEDTDFGGVYYIGYYEDDLIPTNRAIYKEHDLSKAPCGGCTRFNLMYYRKWSSYMTANAIYVNPTSFDELGNFDVKKVEFSTRNFGLNVEVEFRCDLTSFLIENSRPLAYPLMDRLAMDLMRYIEMSPTRNNSVTDEMAKESYIAINGVLGERGDIKVRGLIHDYMDKIKGLSFEYSRLDPVCLPCNRKGIKWNK